MFSWFSSATSNQEEQHRITLEQCKTKMQAFGTLNFGERHHPWIRHLSIEWYFSDAGLLCFLCRGPTVQYAILYFEPEMWKEEVMRSKEAVEDHVAEVFLRNQYVNPSNTIGTSKHDYETRHRLALYVDYKFYKAMNKKD